MIPPKLRNVFENYTRRVDTPVPIGRDGRVRLNVFLDLMSASHDHASLVVLAKYYSSWLDSQIARDSYGAIAAPKLGNTLLAHEVARQLTKRTVFVKSDILFGRWTEGSVVSGETVVLMDDIASDGGILAEAAEALKCSGIFVKHIAVLVDRSEGTAKDFFKKLDIDFRFCLQVDDKHLDSLMI